MSGFHIKVRPKALHKLVSSQGTLLGTVTIPEQWEEILARERYVRFAMRRPWSVRDATADPNEVPLHSLGGLFLVEQDRDGGWTLRLSGLTLEEFERAPGCSFQPGAAYLRSVIGP